MRHLFSLFLGVQSFFCMQPNIGQELSSDQVPQLKAFTDLSIISDGTLVIFKNGCYKWAEIRSKCSSNKYQVLTQQKPRAGLILAATQMYQSAHPNLGKKLSSEDLSKMESFAQKPELLELIGVEVSKDNWVYGQVVDSEDEAIAVSTTPDWSRSQTSIGQSYKKKQLRKISS